MWGGHRVPYISNIIWLLSVINKRKKLGLTFTICPAFKNKEFARKECLTPNAYGPISYRTEAKTKPG